MYTQQHILVCDDDDRWRGGVGGDSIKCVPVWINRKVITVKRNILEKLVTKHLLVTKSLDTRHTHDYTYSILLMSH